ncbi:uncharacterized protein LOC117141460 [Drosophila mauritiana]|uniref:Uncharacterized protein LOC117141460 n=1 Tax=Drosophila mauritiana TaxID=7226 RepID=A0A6P8K9A4_DROMA|nr:uncharacterized protein LOC117141460 [Drosophila mauritiana]
MTGQAKRRRTAQQILLRRALAKSVSGGLDHGAVVSPPLSKDSTRVNGIQERSSSRSAMKLHRILASNTLKVLRERKTAGNLPGCELQSRDSLSWGKLKPSEDNWALSGHSLKTKEHSRGSSRSRHSTSNYPSTWQLNISRAKEELKKVSTGSLDEIINCSILNRTPYDHQLSTPLKSDNSCQCTIEKKARKRFKKNKAVSVAETQTINEDETRNYSEERKPAPDPEGFQKLKKRVNSGEEYKPQRKVSKTPSRSSENSMNFCRCKEHISGPTYSNYGGYSPSDTEIEMGSEYEVKLPSRYDHLNKIEKVSKPPTNADTKWRFKMPSNSEVQEYMASRTYENLPVRQNKNMDQDREIQRKKFNSPYERKKVKERPLKCQGRNYLEVPYDSLIETPREFYGRNKLTTNPSQVSLENFVNRNNKGGCEEMMGHGKYGKQNIYQDDGRNSSNFYQATTNEYPYCDQDDSDTPSKGHDTQPNYNQMRRRSHRQAKAPRRSYGNEDSFRGSFEMGNGYRYPTTPKCIVAVTQTSTVFLEGHQEQPRSKISKTGTATSNSRLVESHEGQSQVVQSKSAEPKNQERQRNQGSFEQTKSDKTNFQSQPINQDDFKAQTAKAKGLRPVQSNSLVIESQEDQEHLVQSSSETVLPKVTAPKNKKPISTKKRKSSRGCSCCSRSSSRKRSVKKPTTKSQVCENCQCKRSEPKNQDAISKSVSKDKILKRDLSQTDNCDVREILNILQKTVAGLQKQINSRKGFGKYENSKTANEEGAKTYSRQRKQFRMEREAYGQPVGPFQNQYSFNEDTFQEIQYNERPKNLGNKFAYSERGASNGNGNPSNMCPSNSYTYFKGQEPFKNNATYQGNTINGRTLQDSFNNGSLGNEPFNNVRTSRQSEYGYPEEICERKSQPYRTQKHLDHGQNHYPATDYKNQSINQSFNRFCLNSQCSRNTPQMQDHQQHVSTGQPKMESPYSPVSKTNSNSERQAPNVTSKSPCCPCHIINDPDQEQRNAGMSLQNRSDIRPETYTPNERSGVQEPLQICNDSTCPYALDYFKSWNSQNDPNSNRDGKTEILSRCNPECLGIALNSEISKRPEHPPVENNQGIVTFQVSDQYCAGETTPNRVRNYEDHTQACDNPFCESAGQCSRSWENPNYSKAHSTIRNSKENYQTECDPDCVLNKTFQMSGNAYNYACPDTQKGSENGTALKSEISKRPEHPPVENNQGIVKFQVSDQYCTGETTANRGRNYEDHTQACDNPFCESAGQFPRSWENPNYSQAHSTIHNSKENYQPECDPDCVLNETFQISGNAYNYEDFCGNPYCSEKNTIINDTARSEQVKGCQNFLDPSLDYTNNPELNFYRNSHNHQTDEALYQQELCEWPDRKILSKNPHEGVSVDHSGNRACSNHPRSEMTKNYFQTAQCSPNCPTRPNFSNQGEIKQGSPRVTVLNRHRREEQVVKSRNNREPFQATNYSEFYSNPKCLDRTDRYSKKIDIKEDVCSNSQCPNKMERRHGSRNDDEMHKTYREPKNEEKSSKISSPRRSQLQNCPQNEVEKKSCLEDCPYQKYSPNQKNRRNSGAGTITCANPNCPDNLKSKVTSQKDKHSPQNRTMYWTDNVEKSTKGHICKNSECTAKAGINKDRNKYPKNDKKCASERKCGNEFCKSTKPMNRTGNEYGYGDGKSGKISSARQSSQNEKIPKVYGKNPVPEYEYKENGYNRQRYQNIPQNQTYQVCENPKCPDRFREPVLKNEEKKYTKDLSCNAQCSDKRGTYRVPNEHNGTSERQTVYNERKATGQGNFQREQRNSKLQSKKDTDLNTKSCNQRLKTNDIDICNNPKCPDRLKEPDSKYHCPKQQVVYRINERMEMAPEKDQCHISYDSDSCFEDCPYRHRVLFTDLRKCKKIPKNRSRQRSGKSDNYYIDQIETRICTSCENYVPLKRDRQAIHRQCNLRNAEAKDMHESKENLILRTMCMPPNTPAPVYAKHRDNPLVTDPILTSYDKNILKNFEKFKEEEKNKSQKCAQECPFVAQTEDKPLLLKYSSACISEIEFQNHDLPCDCKSEELIEERDTERKKSKSSIFSCCLKPPKNDNESRSDQETKMKINEKTHSKSSGFSCFRKKNKIPREPKENTPSKSSCPPEKKKEVSASKSRGLAFIQRTENSQEKSKQRERKSPRSTKSGGFLCFKTNNKRPQNENLEEESQRDIDKDPANARIEKSVKEDSSKKPSKRSGFFKWNRKSQKPKAKDTADADCTCSTHSYHDKDVPILKSEDPFRCLCAPKEIYDGEVRVLYDSSFRFQKESCSLAEVPKNTYCHNDSQNPGQDMAEIQEHEVSYCPCSSANGFYKIVR